MKTSPFLSLRTSATLALVLSATLVAAQTRITAPPNKYTPEQDVELGMKAAAEVRQQMPVMRDDEVTSYVEDVGRRLVGAIPADLRRPEFRYSFDVVNVREINAFALPGGPMFVNRGMIEAAKTEGEVAGVMAHELSHVLLRHGTAQASKATKYEIGQVAGAILGCDHRRRAGARWSRRARSSDSAPRSCGSAGNSNGRPTSRARRSWRAPDTTRATWPTCSRRSRSRAARGGPEWLSDHPNPGNRVEYITKEAQSLRVENPMRDTRGFEQVRAHLSRLPPAPTTEQATRNARPAAARPARAGVLRTSRADASRRRRAATSSTTWATRSRISVPSNWRQLQDNNSVTFAPDGAYGQYNGQSIFTHGVELGVARNESHNLQDATDELLDIAGQAQSATEPSVRLRSGQHRESQRAADGPDEHVRGHRPAREHRSVHDAAARRQPALHDCRGAARRVSSYRNVFNRIVGSIDLRD